MSSSQLFKLSLTFPKMWTVSFGIGYVPLAFLAPAALYLLPCTRVTSVWLVVPGGQERLAGSLI